MRRWRAAVVLLVAYAGAAPAVAAAQPPALSAQPPAPSAQPPASPVPAPPRASAAPAPSAAAPGTSASAAPAKPASALANNASAASATCTERVPQGKERPKLSETIASRATSGHALRLRVVVEHGPGETVLPSGFHVQTSEENQALEASGFFLPDPSGAAGPKLTRTSAGARATTTVDLHFVPLPKTAGRNELVLPPVPIAVSRASGELMTLCTAPHKVTVEDPIANDPNPQPKPNPPPRRQLEIWTTAKYVTIAALIAAAAGALAALFVAWWRRRPRPAPPAPPPRPPWEVALESLFDLRHSGLLEDQRLGELYDRVSDIVRRYLGDRYGYDGLESTTREALAELKRVSVPVDVWVLIQQFMQDADLVKFAQRAPTAAECAAALAGAESIIAATRPSEPRPLDVQSAPVEPQAGAAP